MRTTDRLMSLFDDIPRNLEGPSSHDEPQFRYLNQSNRPEASRIRGVLEEWYRHFPIKHKEALRKDFRSYVDKKHLSAIFELYLHELVLRLGCSVEVHPVLLHTQKKPDFLVTEADQTQFYLEAKLVTGETDKDAGARARIYRVYDGINERVQSNKYLIMIKVRRHTVQTPRITEIASFIRTKLEHADYKYLLSQSSSARKVMWTWKENGWWIEISPLPNPKEARNQKTSPIIGISSERATFSKGRESIRSAVVRKAGRYGALDLPYLIAINVCMHAIDIETVENALIGDPKYEVEITPEGLPGQGRWQREFNGAWTKHSGARYTRNSAVLFALRLNAWTAANASLRLFHHPLAKSPYNGVLCQVAQWRVHNNQRELTEGLVPRKLFGLPMGWPE